jgi:hypothetical protein
MHDKRQDSTVQTWVRVGVEEAMLQQLPKRALDANLGRAKHMFSNDDGAKF